MIAAVPLLWLLWFAEAAKHQQQHHQHHQQIQWDPPQLPPYWWRVESGGDDERPQVGQAGATVPIEVVCASSRTLLRMEGIFGHVRFHQEKSSVMTVFGSDCAALSSSAMHINIFMTWWHSKRLHCS